MDKLRKIGEWMWQNKERLVLAVLIAFFCYRLYGVVYPEKVDETAQAVSRVEAAAEEEEDDGPQGRAQGLNRFARNRNRNQAEEEEEEEEDKPIQFRSFRPPKSLDPQNLPENWDVKDGRPPSPPAPPLPPEPVAFNALVKDNPFTAVTSGGGGGRDSGTRPQLRLLNIMELPTGEYRALIQTRTRQWYEEGEQFETYQLLSIDPAGGTVDIFSEQHGRAFTYSLGR